jgi:lipopolysaccharide export system protein LptA
MLLTLAAGARAEKADREKPINLEADRVSVDDAKQIATFEGNVVLTQGTMVIRGDRMVVRQDNEGFKSGTTWGNLAYFRQKRDGFDEFIEGWAERIEYDGRADKWMPNGVDETRRTKSGNYIHDMSRNFSRSGNRVAGADGDGRRARRSPSRRKPVAPPPVPAEVRTRSLQT